MIINTNGFEIGDEVWWINGAHNKIYSAVVYGFEHVINKDSEYIKMIIDMDKGRIYINMCMCFHTEQECQLAYNKLNCKM